MVVATYHTVLGENKVDTTFGMNVSNLTIVAKDAIYGVRSSELPAHSHSPNHANNPKS